jgi:hypothetical protein
LMENEEGIIIISVILGFGLATLFRKACKDKGCYVIKGPKMSDVQPYYFKVDERCYKYSPVVVPCDKQKNKNMVQTT